MLSVNIFSIALPFSADANVERRFLALRIQQPEYFSLEESKIELFCSDNIPRGCANKQFC